MSYVSQKKFTQAIGDVMTEEIISKSKYADFYSVVADEVRDISGKEWMSLVLKYIDQDMNFREDFLKFIHCQNGLLGKALASQLLDNVESFRSDTQKYRGQAYDGPGNVARRINGLVVRIMSLNLKALYTDCNSHVLNLAIAKVCSICCVKSILDEVKDFFFF